MAKEQFPKRYKVVNLYEPNNKTLIYKEKLSEF